MSQEKQPNDKFGTVLKTVVLNGGKFKRQKFDTVSALNVNPIELSAEQNILRLNKKTYLCY